MITKFGPAKISSSPNTTASRLVHVAGRTEHEEEHAVVALELGSLVRLDRILDRELVEPEARTMDSSSSRVGS